jgi:hypothetical protein
MGCCVGPEVKKKPGFSLKTRLLIRTQREIGFFRKNPISAVKFPCPAAAPCARAGA